MDIFLVGGGEEFSVGWKFSENKVVFLFVFL